MNVFSELREGLKISFGAIRANKMRAVLTTLGIIIGVVTVTLMGTAIEGLNQSFMQSISSLGADVLYVDKRLWMPSSQEEWIKMNRRRDVTIDQAQALERQAHFASAIAPMVDDSRPVKFKNRRSDNVTILGTTEQFLSVGGVGIAEGRFLSASEAQGGRPVCVIGSEVATNLFPREAALGNRITVGPRSFEVVGVLEKQATCLVTGVRTAA
jgi:putative ABC transport system permease protein